MSEASTVHICRPFPFDVRIARERCWGRCQRRRYLLVEIYEWYGATVTCLRCGDQWSDGELMERPFARGWRKKSVERAKARWRNRAQRIRPLEAAPPVAASPGERTETAPAPLEGERPHE